ncbi:MAG TPA: LamG-like jellyroll fold domain-containing protein [Ktedonobacterales bacterium]|nr:LamG-like jellyroll fold domain-containing protein [Ktedonobacterales bacterium]
MVGMNEPGVSQGRRARWLSRRATAAMAVALIISAIFAVQPMGSVLAGTNYAATILADSPVSYWRLGEQSGSTALDSGGGGNNGTIYGGTTLGAAGAIAGDSNTAMTYDGATGFVGVPDRANLDITGDMTLEMWARPGVLNGSSQTVLQKSNSSSTAGPGWQYRISVGTTNQWKAAIYVGSTTYQVTDTTDVLRTSRWDYLVLVRSGSTLTFSVNNQNVGSISITGATNTSTGMLAFGRAGSFANFYLNGGIDEVAVYNKALSASQIQSHYAAGGSPGGAGTPYSTAVLGNTPAGYWRLGEQSGLTAYDSGASGLNGTIYGGATLGAAGAISGDSNTAMTFNGSSGYVGVPDNASLDSTGDITIEVWAKPGALNGTTQTVLQKGDSSTAAGPGWQYRISLASNNQWKGILFVGSAQFAVVDFYDTPSTSRWDYLVLVRSGSTLTFSVNGQVVNTTSITGATNTSTGPLAIGRAGGYSNYYFNGSVDEVAIYGTALTTGQIQSHYTAAGGILPTPTPTPTASNDPVVMAAGDIACDSNNGSYNGGAGSASACQEFWTAAQLAGATAVLSLGDNQYECGLLQSYQNVYDPTWGQQKAITYPTAGNHEYDTTCPGAIPGAPGYYTYFGTAASPQDTNCTVNCLGYYSYNLGSWHVVVLNSECAQIGGCQAGSAEEQWLQADLAAHPAACTLAYWHRPYYSSGTNLGDTELHDIWTDLYSANVDLVLNGHDHDYERFAPQDANGAFDPARGITQIVVGTGGRSQTAFIGIANNSLVRSNIAFGVLQLTLHAGSYDWQFIPDGKSGTFVDSGTASCH